MFFAEYTLLQLYNIISVGSTSGNVHSQSYALHVIRAFPVCYYKLYCTQLQMCMTLQYLELLKNMTCRAFSLPSILSRALKIKITRVQLYVASRLARSAVTIATIDISNENIAPPLRNDSKQACFCATNTQYNLTCAYCTHRSYNRVKKTRICTPKSDSKVIYRIEDPTYKT